MRTWEQLRSHRWHGDDGLRAFSHRARTRQLGIGAEEHVGKPVIGIVNTWSTAPQSARPRVLRPAPAIKE